MAKNSGFLLGFLVGSISAYGITKYVLPMSSKEDVVEKFNDVKESITDSVDNFDKEKMINNFNERTANLKANIDGQVNKKLASNDNFENIVIDEANIDMDN